VMDEAQNKPVEFATVALINPQTEKPITGTTTDEQGKFTINNVQTGIYRIIISFLGYDNKTISTVTVSKTGVVTALGVVSLRANSQTLNEVVVTGEKALIEDKDDRLVYNCRQGFDQYWRHSP
jgi:hypothetical protein